MKVCIEWFFMWPAWIIIGWLVGNKIENPTSGILLGVFLGLCGCAVYSFVKDDRPRCPCCSHLAPPVGKPCSNCGRIFVAPVKTLSRKFSAEKVYIKCPNCAEFLDCNNLTIGQNKCPICKREFKVDGK